jgi:hypothetical protein
VVEPQTKTVAVDSTLLARAEREAEKRGVTLKKLVEDALERRLADEERSRRCSPRLGLGRSNDGMSAAEIASESVAAPPRRATEELLAERRRERELEERKAQRWGVGRFR